MRAPQGKTQGHTGGPAGLAGQSGQRDHAAGPAGAFGRGAGHQRAQIGRLEKAEAGPAHAQAQHQVQRAGLIGQQGQRQHACTQHGQADAAQQPGWVPVRQAPAKGAAAATTTGQADIRKPVSTGLRCSTCSRKNGKETKARPWVAKALRAVSTDSANSGRRSRSTGSIGAGCPAWRHSSSAPATTVTLAGRATRGQGSCWAAAPRAPIRVENVRAVNTAVNGSKPWSRGVLCGSVCQPKPRASRPSGTLMANSQGQSATLSTSEATVGPTAKNTPTTSAFMPTPRPRREAGYSSRIKAMFTLMMAAAPMPCRPRARASKVSVGASAQASEARVKKARPPMNTRRGPIRSPSAAKGSSRATVANW